VTKYSDITTERYKMINATGTTLDKVIQEYIIYNTIHKVNTHETSKVEVFHSPIFSDFFCTFSLASRVS